MTWSLFRLALHSSTSEEELTGQTYTFARDLRTWTMLCEAMDENQDKMGKVSARLRKLLGQLRELGGDSKQGVRGRLRDLTAVVDVAE